MAVIVEFTGMTGAGKTTLVEAVKDLLCDQGFVARDAYDVVLERLGLKLNSHPSIRSLLIDLLALFPALRYLMSRRGSSLLALGVRAIPRDAEGLLEALNLWRNFFKRIGVHFMLSRLSKLPGQVDFAVYDEGILHIAHNLFVHTGSEPNPAEVIHFGNIVPKPDVIVWVKSSETQSMGTILKRGHPRVASSEVAAREFVQNGMRTFEILCSQRAVQEKLFTVVNGSPRDSSSVRDHARAVAAYLVKSRAATPVHA